MDTKLIRQASLATVFATLIHWFFLPLSFLLGAALPGRGARALIQNGLSDLALKYTLFFVGTYFFVTFPTRYLIYGDERKMNPMVRALLLVFLLALPLGSLAYNLGNFRDSVDFAETALFVGGALISQVMLFEFYRSELVFTFGMSLGIFLPLFVCNELLGPYHVYFTYAPVDSTLSNLHRGFALASLAFVAWQTRGAWLGSFGNQFGRSVLRQRI